MTAASCSVLMVAGLLLLGPARCGNTDAKPQEELTVMQSPIQMQADIQATPEALEVSYVVKNESSEPVLLLDTLWTRQAKGYDPNWAFVEIRGSKALVKRIMETKPKGLAIDRPPVPFGRLLEPGATLDGKFKLPLPLAASNPYDATSCPK